jgi:hypothetical protein
MNPLPQPSLRDVATLLTKTQRSIIRLLGLDPRTYGLA